MPVIETKGAASAQGFGEFAKSGAVNYIEEVFSTYLYTGTGSTQTITNGIDLSGKGGLVWIKGRSGATDHALYDTARGTTKDLVSNSTAAETTQSTGLTAFSSTGFSIGALAKLNTNAATYASWTFREQPKFFDIVTYTGDGANRTIAHNLGSVPGCIIIKRTDTTAAWAVYHRSLANTEYLVLNTTAAKATGTTYWNSTTPTATEFSLGTATDVNANTGTYVAYLFAHDAGGFGLTGTDNVISCGSFTVDGLGEFPQITLGYEPQFFIAKRISGTGDWFVMDTMRGFINNENTSDVSLAANTSAAEAFGSYGAPVATGVIGTAGAGTGSFASGDYIYIAIRRGPMKVPTSGTSVFSPVTYTGTGAARSLTAGFPIDLAMFKYRGGATNSFEWFERLLGTSPDLFSAYNYAELATTTEVTSFASNTQVSVGASNDTGGTNANGQTYVLEAFQRAPSFFDIVCYAGTGSNTTQTHNLGAVPELILVKRRGAAADWQVYSASLLNTEYLVLNSTAAKATGTTRWNSTTPTASVFSLGTDATVNASGSTGTYVAYLFTTCLGVSKVGSYTGTGNTLQVDCGFTGGARFILIKRTDSTGDWYVWDSARGIVAGNDPYLRLNSIAAEVTNTDWVDTHNPGFELSNAAGNNVNINTATYLFLAVA